VWDGIDSEPDAEHNESGAYPHGSAEGRAQVANDQESRNPGDLVGSYYPSSLAAGQAKSTLYG